MSRRLAQIAVALLTAALPCGGAAAEIVVAVAAPLSGQRQVTGEAVRHAAERAVGAINAAGGLLGERVGVIVEDDGCEAAKAAAVATSLVERKPAAVIGHPCSGAAVTAAPIYAAANLIFIAPGVRHPALTDPRAGPTVFRLAGRDDRQGEAAAQWLARTAARGRIGLIHDRTRYARTIAEDTAKRLRAAGVAPQPMLTIVAGRQDYDAIARSLKERGAEVAFFAGYPSEARVIVAGFRRLGLDTPFLGSDSLATPEFADGPGADALKISVLVAREPAAEGPWRENEARDGGGADAASSPAALTYAAVEVWAEGVRQANAFEPKAVSGALERGTIKTSALGPVSFDDNGDARVVSFAPAVWNGASWEPRD
jgi:branched-chain amino acid transport system substrate-binding protein